MAVELTWEEKTYVWTRRGVPHEGEYYIAETGAFCRCGSAYVFGGGGYEIFVLKPRRHTFGKPVGVVFEETGEKRAVQRGEWFLNIEGRSQFAGSSLLDERIILRPIAIEGQP